MAPPALPGGANWVEPERVEDACLGECGEDVGAQDAESAGERSGIGALTAVQTATSPTLASETAGTNALR